MANRTFQTESLGLLKRPVELYAQVNMSGTTPVLKKLTYPGGGNVVSANAPTSGSGYGVGNGAGVCSVSRTGQGTWTFTLSDPYRSYLGVELSMYMSFAASPQNVAAVTVDSTSNCSTNTSPGSGGVIKIILVDFAGSAVDPTSGDSLWFRFTFADSTEP